MVIDLEPCSVAQEEQEDLRAKGLHRADREGRQVVHVGGAGRLQRIPHGAHNREAVLPMRIERANCRSGSG